MAEAELGRGQIGNIPTWRPSSGSEQERLARGPKGEAIVKRDTMGIMRYLRVNGVIDPESTVDGRVATHEVERCISIGQVAVLGDSSQEISPSESVVLSDMVLAIEAAA